MPLPILPTTLVGSFPQPDWLIDREKLSKQVPRVQANLWLVKPSELEVKQDQATIDAIKDQESVGLDIITDGEMRRESYSSRFATALAGVDTINHGTTINRMGKPIPVPRVTGKIVRKRPVEVRDMEFLRASTKHPVKMTLPGPFTMAKQAQDDFYKDEAAMAMDYADAVNAEIKDLFKAGADIVQIDEPWMAQYPDKAREYGVKALNRALDGVDGTIAVHLCFGYAAVVKDKAREYGFLAELEGSKANQISIEAAQPDLDLKVLREMPSKTIILGVISLGDLAIETPEIVATRIRKAFDHVPPERVVIAPDCGMKYLPREVALGKLKAMVEGTKIVRREIGC
jgi:5-methyltetrahydropteroyltriglutamate--homocysteine methyltransferase